MNGKIVIALLITINSCYTINGAVLRRTPKVYNALITTDENLTPSRAFPVIQPSIHEGGLTHYPYGPYSPYGYYTPPVVRFGQPIVPGLTSQSAPTYPLPQSQFPPQFISQPPTGPSAFYPDFAVPSTEPSKTPEAAESQADKKSPAEDAKISTPPTPAAEPNIPEKSPNVKPPIPLNEFGLPPSLIPLSQFPNYSRTPSGLPPYHFQQFPLAYNPISGYRDQYLPHFGFYPGHTFAVRPNGLPNGQAPQQQQTPLSQQPLSSTLPTDLEDITDNNDIFADSSDQTTEANFENIKNGSKPEDKNVKDVPPPPIPSGAKSQSS